jgi:branched-chain amino acid aminotransferase, group I
MTTGVCWLDGRVLPLEEARIPVLDHGLLYGDGVFEGIRFYFGRPFLLGEHLERLRRSARAIALACPWSDDELARIVGEVVSAFGEPEGYIRLVVTRGEGPLGIDPAPCREPRLIVIAARLEMVNHARRQAGVRLVIAATRRLPPDGLDPRIKSLNYLNHILARIEANAAGADEAVLLNARGQVAEGTADNLLIVRNNSLFTPPVTDGALEGITRRLVMELAEKEGIPVREQSLAPWDLHTADECFLTGTGAELVPVREIDGRPLPACPGPLYRRCNEAFRAFIQRECGGSRP